MTHVHEPRSSRLPDVVRHYLGDLVFGANDGLITTFAVVSGVSGADLGPSVILILGVANLLADGFSMGASSFLAIRSDSKAHGMDRGLREPMVHGLATFAAFVVAGSVPLIAYVVPGLGDAALWASSISATVVLFAVGAMRSLLGGGAWFRCGGEMLLVGAAAGVAAYSAGALIRGVV